MAVILFVRVESDLDDQELEGRVHERVHRSRGLTQKLYGQDHETSDMGGIHFFESREALTDFANSELAKTIPGACEATEIRREAFPLHPGRGRLSE